MKAAHAFVLFGIYIIVRSLLRTIARIEVKRELNQRRMKVETWHHLPHHQKMDLEADLSPGGACSYRLFDGKFRELDALSDKPGNLRLAVVRYNHDDDTFDLVKPLMSRDSHSDEDGDHYSGVHHIEDVAMVERILGERKEHKESNALRFLTDLH